MNNNPFITYIAPIRNESSRNAEVKLFQSSLVRTLISLFKTSPVDGLIKSNNVLNNVVLPAPDGEDKITIIPSLDEGI